MPPILNASDVRTMFPMLPEILKSSKTTISFSIVFSISKRLGLGVSAMAKIREILSFSKSFLVVRFATSWMVAPAVRFLRNASEMTSSPA